MWRCGRRRSIPNWHRTSSTKPADSASQPVAPVAGSASQQSVQRVGRIRLGQCGFARKHRGKRAIGAVTRYECKRNFQRLQPLGDRKAVFADQPDIEQGKIRRAIGDRFKRLRHASGGPHRLHAETQDGVLEIERDDRIILDDQHVAGHGVGRCGFHGLTDKRPEIALRAGKPALDRLLSKLARFGAKNQLTNTPTSHCFLVFSDYIAAQRVGFARSFWPGFLFGRYARLPNSRFLSVIRKSGSRFSGEIALQPLSEPEEQL